jgi:methionyl-tRNA formyltransferase
MADNRDYKALILSSDPATIDELTGIAREHFQSPTVIYWEMGNEATKPAALRQIEATQYNVVISYINGIILKRHHLGRAHFGALNIHPAPPEHGGAFGIWCQPVIRRDVRTHHGVTVHEMDEDIDHGPIYEVRRWEVGEEATIQSVVDRTSDECLAVCAHVAAKLARSPDGTRCFQRLGDTWHPTNRHHTVADVRQWFEALDPAHPAHRERVPFNHPRAIIGPPYFDDL